MTLAIGDRVLATTQDGREDIGAWRVSAIQDAIGYVKLTPASARALAYIGSLECIHRRADGLRPASQTRLRHRRTR